ncbi:MAG: YgaP family membrane protein [Longimicrobiales bacterium]
MKCNMGKADRIIRAIVGIAVIGAGFYFHSWWGLIGVILLGTTLLGFCPAYVPFRINTGGKTD